MTVTVLIVLLRAGKHKFYSNVLKQQQQQLSPEDISEASGQVNKNRKVLRSTWEGSI